MEGLANGSYTFTVTARNPRGTSPRSAPTAQPVWITRPTDVQAESGQPGAGKIHVSWTPPDTAITIESYEVTSSPGPAHLHPAAAETSGTVAGLVGDRAYTFTVTADRSDGLSASSEPSNPTTPTPRPPAPPEARRRRRRWRWRWRWRWRSGCCGRDRRCLLRSAGTEAVFIAAVSDDTRISALRWTVTGPDGFTATSNAPRLAFAAPAGGTYTVSVTVDDVARRTLTASVTLTVFGDIAGQQFVNEIIWLAEEGTTRGCTDHSYCPNNPVTRAQMASFLARALDLQAPRQQAGFADVDPASVHGANIEALFAAQITAGCTQQPLQYCPNNPVTRAQMASFLARALDLQAPRQQAGFADVDPASVHGANIEALFAAQITAGCTQQPLQYCPNRPVTRAQMAAFLYRARDLISTVRISAGT